ncbi:hypothetical protein KFE25_001247 [Diacronema lutheri]|uniref:ACT domain-containing protein n=3 Tax=Diacronema lutheri TaxID=2081491 RepID=A0A8J5XJK8_DIALT|nr:hypothetical protein KFE25_001247 [Diacronema lutheri]
MATTVGRVPRAVHKFGGTSVQSADAMRQVREIIAGIAAEQADDSPLAIVVSAMGGKPKVTDLLIDTVGLAAAGQHDDAHAVLAQVRAKHEAAMAELFAEPAHAAERAALGADLAHDLDDVAHLLRAVSLLRAADQRLVGVIAGYGEQWSARMMAALLRVSRTPPGGSGWVYLDARSVLVVDDEISTGVSILWDESAARLREFARAHEGASVVITGFIASTRDGGITTLGRDGSDYSASVFGRLLEAESITIWTDVSGVLSADPRVVADAYVLPEVSYNEAAELAHFGAKVVHPKTMQPALARLDWRPDARSIPIFIRNTFSPTDRGTRIFETSELTTSREVCGVSAMRGMCLVNVMGRGMVGIPGVASRLFSALHALGVNVSAIAQASSEQSISLALLEADGRKAQAAVRDAFRHELGAGHIEDVQLVPDVAIIAVVGDGMSHRPGIAGKVMGALGMAGVNVRAIAQGCNETNITTIVDGNQALRALRAVHAAFLASLTVAVGVVARSAPVAAELLASFGRHAPTSQERFGVNPKVAAFLKLDEHRADGGPDGACGIERVRRGLRLARERASLDGGAWFAEPNAGGDGADEDLAAFTKAMLAADVPMRVIVDASDSAEAAARHCVWLRSGIHVVTNNSAALTTGLAQYAQLCTARRESTARYIYGTAYGDWLPVASTVTTLLASGDVVRCVEGVLSASVSHVLNALAPAAESARAPRDAPLARFSTAVRAAYELGLFEQDLLDDLSGAHSARQLLCLARDLGYELELADIDVQPLVPRARPGGAAAPAGGDAVEAAMAEHDEQVGARVAAAAARGCVLRLVGRLEYVGGAARPRAHVRAEEVPPSHPFSALSGSAISVVFHSSEAEQPLVISGAISQRSCVNALYSDLIRLARSLDARARDRGPTAAPAHVSAAHPPLR